MASREDKNSGKPGPVEVEKERRLSGGQETGGGVKVGTDTGKGRRSAWGCGSDERRRETASTGLMQGVCLQIGNLQ